MLIERGMKRFIYFWTQIAYLLRSSFYVHFGADRAHCGNGPQSFWFLKEWDTFGDRFEFQIYFVYDTFSQQFACLALKALLHLSAPPSLAREVGKRAIPKSRR